MYFNQLQPTWQQLNEEVAITTLLSSIKLGIKEIKAICKIKNTTTLLTSFFCIGKRAHFSYKYVIYAYILHNKGLIIFQ